MAILYTGFKGVGNSSYLLVNQIAAEKLLLTNSFNGLRKDIESLSKNYKILSIQDIVKYQQIEVEYMDYI